MVPDPGFPPQILARMRLTGKILRNKDLVSGLLSLRSLSRLLAVAMIGRHACGRQGQMSHDRAQSCGLVPVIVDVGTRARSPARFNADSGKVLAVRKPKSKSHGIQIWESPPLCTNRKVWATRDEVQQWWGRAISILVMFLAHSA